MPEIVGTFARSETRDEGANGSTQRWDGPGGDLAQESFEFAVGNLDRVKVGGILGQIAKGCVRGLDRLANARNFVGSNRRYRFALVLAQDNVQRRQETFVRSSVHRTPSVPPSCRDEALRRK